MEAWKYRGLSYVRRPTRTVHIGDVALGSEAARALGYPLGAPVVVTHGLAGTGISDHDDKRAK